MEDVVRTVAGIFYFFAVIVLALMAASTAASWAAVEVRVPPFAVGTVVGFLAFIAALPVLFALGELILDVIFFRNCRELLGEILIEKWKDWTCTLPAALAAVFAWYFSGPLAAGLTFINVFALVITGIYVYSVRQVAHAAGRSFYK